MNGEVQLIVNNTVLAQIDSVSNDPTYVGIGALSRLIVNSTPEVNALTTGDVLTIMNAAGQSVNKTLNSPAVVDSPVVGQTRLNFSGTWAQDYSAAAGGYFMLSVGGEYYLDLFENESISQNWRFTDLNNFQSLGAFSREFRVPFSERNQFALGALFDVNVDVGSANFFHYKLPAEIRVDTLPIASGYLRVRKVYRQQGKINEVELAFYAETPDLVRKIGEKKLKDIVDLPNLDEVVDYANVTTPNSNRIWTLLERGQLWSEAGELNTRSLFDFDNPVRPADLTPAVRFDYLFEQIIKDAGFELVGGSLTSILSTYYMPWLNSKAIVASDSYNQYFFRVYNSASAALSTTATGVNVNTEIFDNNGDFNGGTATYTTPTEGYYTFRFRNKFSVSGTNNVSYFLQIDGVLIFLNNFNVVNDQIIDFTYRIGIDAGSVVKFYLKKNNAPSVTLVAGDGTFETSIWELIQTEFYYGQTIYYNLNAPDAKQIDFITDVVKMHNCVIIPDRVIGNKLYIVPQTSYLGSGGVKDWTRKLDISKDVVISSTVDIQKGKFQFTYTAGEDVVSKQYKNVNRVYGDYEAVGYTINPDVLPSDFALGDQKIQLVTQSTPCGVVNGSTTVIPMFINEQLDFVAPGMRCLFHGGDVNIELLDDSTGFPSVTTTPVLSHYSQVIADIDDYDLNWAPEVPPYGIIANPYNNLFNLYWRTYMNALYSPEARIMEASFALDLKDILTFSFADKIWIEDCYWRILEISDYKVGMNESTSVKLIKFLEDTEDCSSTPNSISVNGQVNFVDADGNPVTATQDCCTRYGYNWEESNTTCWAFTSNGQSRTNNVSGNSTTPAVRETPTAVQTRAVLNSVINGENVTIDIDNKDMLAVGTDLTLNKDVQGSNLLGKNVTTNLPGIHVGGGYRDGDPSSTYYGWAQFGTFVLQKQIPVVTSGDVFDLDIEGRLGEFINMPDDTLWSCLLNVTIKDNTGLSETSLHHLTLEKVGGLAAASAITTLSTIGAIGANVFTFGIDTTTNTDEHRINVTVTGGTYPDTFIITASLQYQQSKTT